MIEQNIPLSLDEILQGTTQRKLDEHDKFINWFLENRLSAYHKACSKLYIKSQVFDKWYLKPLVWLARQIIPIRITFRPILVPSTIHLPSGPIFGPPIVQDNEIGIQYKGKVLWYGDNPYQLLLHLDSRLN